MVVSQQLWCADGGGRADVLETKARVAARHSRTAAASSRLARWSAAHGAM